MATDARAYRNTLLTLLVVVLAIAPWYSSLQNIPSRIALWFIAAALVEVAFYLGTGFSWTRSLVESIEPPAVRAFILTLSALLPYGIYSLGTGTFHLRNLWLLAGISTVVTAWFVVQNGKRPLTDLLFVVLLAAIVLGKVFDHIYITLTPRAPADILGKLMLIRLGAYCVLTIRKMPGIGFGFVPSRRDWTIGVLCFAALMPVLALANTFAHFVTPRLVPGPWWRVVLVGVGTFLGFLWVAALSEEFVFRGIIQQVLSQRLGTIAGLVIASIIFGLIHLPFREFPNYRLPPLAFIAGLFYGLAYLRAGNIRAGMVTHALVVATWRVFFA